MKDTKIQSKSSKREKQKISNSRVRMRDVDKDNMEMSLKDEANGMPSSK